MFIFVQLIWYSGAINGNWATWGKWSQCSESTECLKGTRKRVRTCSNPAPSKGGDDCQGSSDEIEVCPKTNCKGLIWYYFCFGKRIDIG